MSLLPTIRKKLLFDLIGQILDLDQRKEYLKNLRDIILTEEEKPKGPRFNLLIQVSPKSLINILLLTLLNKLLLKKFKRK